MFITALTSARQLSLSWASPIQSIYPHPTYCRSILILSTHLRLGLPIGLLPSDFPTKTSHTPFLNRGVGVSHEIFVNFYLSAYTASYQNTATSTFLVPNKFVSNQSKICRCPGVQTTKAYRGSGGIAPLILNLWNR